MQISDVATVSNMPRALAGLQKWRLVVFGLRGEKNLQAILIIRQVLQPNLKTTTI